jgi:hypothetical protein
MMSTTGSEDIYDSEIVGEQAKVNEPVARDSERNGTPTGMEPSSADLALKRLREYINTSLAEPDAETAMLGVCNGSLMRMLLHLQDGIECVLAERPTGSEHLQVLARGIEMTLRLTWQINRFTQLRLALKEAGEATARLTNR